MLEEEGAEIGDEEDQGRHEEVQGHYAFQIDRVLLLFLLCYIYFAVFFIIGWVMGQKKL